MLILRDAECNDFMGVLKFSFLNFSFVNLRFQQFL